MKLSCRIALCLLAVAGGGRSRQRVSNGFEVRETVNAGRSAGRRLRRVRRLAAWWDPEHTYSGNSANLSLELDARRCFCERIPKTAAGSSIMRVTYVDPGKRIVLTGALGPAAFRSDDRASWTCRSRRIAGGSQLIARLSSVAGFANGGADKLAPAVDQVLGGQMKRFRAYATSRPTHLDPLERHEAERRAAVSPPDAPRWQSRANRRRRAGRGMKVSPANVVEHFGQLDPVGERQEQREDVRAADHRNRFARRQAQAPRQRCARPPRPRRASCGRESARCGGARAAGPAGCRRSCGPSPSRCPWSAP